MRLYAVLVTLFAAGLAVAAISLAFHSERMEKIAWRAHQQAQQWQGLAMQCGPVLRTCVAEYDSCMRDLSRCTWKQVKTEDPCL